MMKNLINTLRAHYHDMPNKIVVTYRKALQNKPELDHLLLTVANQTGAKPISNLKDPQTALKKVETKNEEDPKRNYKLDDVNDIARGRLVYGTKNEMKQGIKIFEKDIKGTDMKIVKKQDFFDNPEDGYKGYHIDVEFPNGQHSEIQFHTVNSYAATLATHQAHAQFDHGEMPEDIRKTTVKANDAINKLNPRVAAEVAQMLEQKNAPIQAQSQVAALHTAMQPAIPVAGGQQ